jgi:hypothetical protein
VGRLLAVDLRGTADAFDGLQSYRPRTPRGRDSFRNRPRQEDSGDAGFARKRRRFVWCGTAGIARRRPVKVRQSQLARRRTPIPRNAPRPVRFNGQSWDCSQAKLVDVCAPHRFAEGLQKQVVLFGCANGDANRSRSAPRAQRPDDDPLLLHAVRHVRGIFL